METKETLHDGAIDMLRLLAILGVIGIHTTTVSLQLGGNVSHANLSFFFNQVLRFAVPLFFLMSGFVLHTSNHTTATQTFLSKRLRKIFIPYVFWSCFYYLVIFPHQANNFLITLFTGTAAYHLYFIPTLCVFYFVFPLIIRFSHVFLHPLFLLGAITAQLYLLQQTYYLIPVEISSPISVALLNSGVFLLGIALSAYKTTWQYVFYRYRALLFSLTSILALIVFYQGISQYLLTHNYQRYYSQWRPTVFVYTVCLSCTLYSSFQRKAVLIALLKTLASLSFFVYFIHVALIEIVKRITTYFHTQLILTTPFAGILLFAMITSVSFVLGLFVHKIKILTVITG